MEELIQKVLPNIETSDEAMFHNALSLLYNIKGDYNRAAQEVELALVHNSKVPEIATHYVKYFLDLKNF